MNRKITNIYFSPGGTTAEVAKQISANLSDNAESIDLLRDKMAEPRQFGADELIVVALPVFFGRLPAVCLDMLAKLRGSGTPAIAVVVYGNRDFDDALLELTDILKAGRFTVVGAAAVVARHSLFPQVAEGRPNGTDFEKLKAFTDSCLSALEDSAVGAATVPGNNPYQKAGTAPLAPKGNARCNGCGACVRVCPMGAIPADRPRHTDKSKCINCTACVYVCPQSARQYGGLVYGLASKMFAKKCSASRDAAFFLPDDTK